MRNFEDEFKSSKSGSGKKSAVAVIIILIILLLVCAFFVARFIWQSGQSPEIDDPKVTLFSDSTGIVSGGDIMTLPPELVYTGATSVIESDGSTKYVYTDEIGSQYEVPPPVSGENSRREGVYTFLIAGLDESKAHADVIMVATYDTVGQTLNAMSIPRDTYSNVNNRSSSLKHITLSYQSGGIDNLLYEVYNLVGFYPDFYVTVDWNGFISIINYIGGVNFDVPVTLELEGQYIEEGYQWLSGAQALAVCRYRAGYIDADIGRIRTRDAFIKATAEQLLSGSTVVRAAEIAGAVYDNV
ncbi:MAG: LCP family protein, partial [Clostridia bacterium]|nr:LCP family protein [Clostridia bacterium]